VKQRYRKRANRPVVAVRLALDTAGFDYRKWGDVQHCKAGDWLVDNAGDVYSIDAEVFSRTYRLVNPGLYVKVMPVWAVVATEAGAVGTREGRTHYVAGDMIVSNHEDGSDSYAMSAAEFEAMYELDE
jgi:hypothetical protein